MGIIGNLRRVDLKYAFQVEIVGVGSAEFADCSDVGVTAGEATLWQGGGIIPKKEPTRLTFADLTLSRGMTRDLDLWTWFKMTGSGAANIGSPSPTYKRHLSIVQRDRAGVPIERISIFNAFMKEYHGGDFNNDSDEFRMESIVLAYDWFERLPLTVL